MEHPSLERMYLLHPDAWVRAEQVGASCYTPRLKTGLADRAPVRYKESFGANLRCQRCGLRTAQQWAGGERRCSYYIRTVHF